MLHPLVLFALAILVGFVVLIWGAERFVVGAANTAYNLGVTPLVIGLTIVGLGTSAPEILIAIMSSLESKPDLAIGNAIGSNIANIALILGTTALVLPITVRAGIVTRELPLLMIVTFASILLLWDERLSRLDGALLLGGLIIVMTWIVRYAKQQPIEEVKKEFDIELKRRMSTQRAVLLLLFSIVILIVSSRVLVWGAAGVAEYFGVSDLIIGLTIVAIGTSLPELAASIAAALKQHYELILGNIIGSNIFNILGVMSIPGLLAPSDLAPDILARDIPVMTLLTLALFATAYSFTPHHAGRINRLEGGALLGIFLAYMLYLYVSIAG
jgi:cation:H+ antiporter